MLKLLDKVTARKWLLCFLPLAGIFALIAGYNLYTAIGIRLEENGRLADEQVRSLLAQVRREGTAGAPAILLLHGFGGSPYDIRPLINALPEDIALSAPHLPGHSGHSARELHGIEYIQWRHFVHEHATALLEQHDRLVIIGFSLGGLLALDAAMELDVDAVVLINPYTRVPYRPYYIISTAHWASIGRHFIPYVRKLSRGRINDPEGRKLYDTAYLFLSQQSYLTLDRYSTFIRARLEEEPPACPVFMHIAANDIVSDHDLMLELAGHLQLPDENITIWPRSNHVLLFDYDGPAAIEKIIEQVRFNWED